MVANSSRDSWMQILQAIFDPAQGFVNFIIFVLLSKEDRHNIKLHISSALNIIWCYSPIFEVLSGTDEKSTVPLLSDDNNVRAVFSEDSQVINSESLHVANETTTKIEDVDIDNDNDDFVRFNGSSILTLWSDDDEAVID